MSKPYNQTRALLSITKASLRSIFRSPSAVVFSFVFPFIFIIVFGFIGGGNFRMNVGLASSSDTTSQLYKMMSTRPELNIKKGATDSMLNAQLTTGDIDAIINIQKNNDTTKGAPYIVGLKTSSAAAQNGAILKMFLMHAVDEANLSALGHPKTVAELQEEQVSIREYKNIDFILPGQLGFSLLSTGVFGTAFVFLNLRQTLVIKRFFATPIRRQNIVLGEALSRVVFALITAIIIILVGHFAFGFTLIHGVGTFLQMLILSFLGLLVFMGFGFVVSGIAKNESAVPPLANLITLPQFLLSGTFFSTSNFPKWLQPISNALPLTYLNDAMRKVAFDGMNLIDVWKDVGIIAAWGIVVYVIAIKTFKWE